ncbi:cytochrome p450 [Holotrichia oblita]|uniref:Cytochrome p450 n=1 Tax=Holotrichia oblita TaxID=644536 RepID=A0ACB9SZN6_HOLOL|nr:cytochrome p450 [Holotrichia oblita]
MVFTGNILIDVFSILIATLVVIIVLFKKRYSYWKNAGIEYLEPSIPFGNLKQAFFQQSSIGEWVVEFYNIMKKRKAKHAGCYFIHEQIYVPIDLDLIKRIMQIDFVHFTDHGVYYTDEGESLTATIFAVGGQRWRNLRTKLSPVFTSGKMKLMFPIMLKISQELTETLRRESGENPIDAKDISARFTTDVIGNCAFGIECNSLEDPNTEFRVHGKRLFNPTTYEVLRVFFSVVFPNVMRFFGGRIFPKDATDFFWNVIKDTANYRRENGIRRNDAFQLLLDILNEDGKDNSTLTFDEMAAQAFMFFTAGFETSSTLISFALYELSQNEAVQNNLRDEINKVLNQNNGELTYDALFDTPYLDMVIYETLRKYPPLPNLSRECTQDYRIPDTNVVIRKGEGVAIPVKGIHYDPEYYPDPDKFDPLRFSDKNKSKRHQFAFLPFGEGPRICLAVFKRRYCHWKNMGVECLEPSIPFGNFKANFNQKQSMGEWCLEYYNTMKARNVKHAGCYFLHLPIYVPMDLDVIKNIMQTDFDHFVDHGGYYNEKDDPLSAHLFLLEGQKWRNLRIKLTPTFTSGKMKLMFPIIMKLSQQLVEILQEESANNPIDVKDISARFTTDVIGNCAFGIDCNSLKDPNTEFRVRGKRLFNLTVAEMVTTFFGCFFPNSMRYFGVRLLPKEVTDFFWNIIKENTTYRQKTGIRRNDAFQLLLDMLKDDVKENENGLTFNELAAQAFIFFVAGFETSSSLMSFALLELAVNEDIQERLRSDINNVVRKNNEELTYEDLFEMRYLDMVINETLRKYPPLPNLSRKCTKDYQVSGSNITIHKGQLVSILAKGIHYDPDYYPEPHKFDPTRFSEENKAKRHQFAFLPFGEGPRICLGLRFGVMQAKVGLSSLIRNFKFKLNPRTEYPVQLDPKNFLTSALGGLWIDVEKI